MKKILIVFIFLTISSSYLFAQVMRIFDISGKLFIEKLLVTGVSNIKIPINLHTGIYTVMMFSGGLLMASQKIMVY